MITHDDLIAAGYTRFPANSNLNKGPLYQSHIRDADGRLLYSVNFTEHDLRRHDVPDDVVDNYRWAVDVHLYLDDVNFAAVAYSVRSHTTLKDVEDFYSRAFVALGCIGDPLND